MGALYLDNIMPYIFVFLRMTGLVAFNPIFSRRNVPNIVRAAFVLALTLVLTPVSAVVLPQNMPALTLVVRLLRELFVGLVCSMAFLLFYYLLFFAGDLMDLMFGMSMSKVFDPGANIQASVSGNFLNILFMLYFFATGSHLVMLRAFAASFALVPVGSAVLTEEVATFLLQLFTSAFSMMLRLTLPFVAMEFVLEISMGVLMKLIPQIHVFVINFQFKILLALVMLFLFAQPIGDFMNQYMDAILHSMEKAMLILGGAA